MQYLTEEELTQSPIVANCRMNRARGLSGVNSYQKEFGIDFVGMLMDRVENGLPLRWLDVCCGEGLALLEASEQTRELLGKDELVLEGLDLVPFFKAFDAERHPHVQLRLVSVQDWVPDVEYDLITCIHGLHYLGDKLGVMAKLVGALKEDGLFFGNLDLANVREKEGETMEKAVLKEWKEMGWRYDKRKRLLAVGGKTNWEMKWKYLGAKDDAGPNYTGQEAVNSYYEALV
ncbi:MAG: class I SAM-dependent methyltransferase [Bacteroidota bacterium]